MSLSDADKRRSSVREDIYRIIRIGYVGDVPSRIFDVVIAVSILLNLFIIFFETFDASAAYIGILGRIEFVTVLIFTVEYILRIITADLAYPDRKSYALAVAAFVFSLYGIVDLLSFLPYWIMKVFPAASIPAGVVAFRMLRVVRILRLFRINRYYDAFNVITDVLKEKKNQIASAIFIILMLVIAASIIMYDLEHDAQPESFKNAFSGIWWAVSTLLTVGYGDIYPVTPAGRVVGIILAFLGVGIVAIPTGILSAGFVQQYTRIKDIEGTIEESPIDHIVIAVNRNHMWCGCGINDIKIPDGMMILALVRGGEVIRGDAVVCEGDRLLIGSRVGSLEGMAVGAITIREKSEWTDKSVYHLEDELSVVCTGILRGEETIIPDKDTVVKTGDELIILARGRASKAGGRNNEIMG